MVKITPERLKALRKKLKLTQRQFAELLGVTQVTVARWETGVLPILPTTAIAIRCVVEHGK